MFQGFPDFNMDRLLFLAKVVCFLGIGSILCFQLMLFKSYEIKFVEKMSSDSADITIMFGEYLVKFCLSKVFCSFSKFYMLVFISGNVNILKSNSNSSDLRMVKNKVPEKMGFNVGIKALKRMLKESKAAKPKASSKYRRKIEYGEIEYTNATIPVNFPYFIV